MLQEIKTQTQKIDKNDLRNQELVQKVQGGNTKALSELCAFNQKFIFNLLLQRTMNNRELSEDLTQDTMIKMVASINGYRKSEFKFRTWLSKIALTVAIDYYRANKNSVDTLAKYMDFNLTLGSDEIGGQTADNYATLKSINTLRTASVEDNFIADSENKRLMSQIMEGIDALPNVTQRRVVVLSLIEEMKYDEIAEKLDITLSNVKVLLHRAKADILKHIVSNNTRFVDDKLTREVMEMHYGKNMNVAHIAKATKTSVKEVESMLNAGLRQLNREKIFTSEVLCVN